MLNLETKVLIETDGSLILGGDHSNKHFDFTLYKRVVERRPEEVPTHPIPFPCGVHLDRRAVVAIEPHNAKYLRPRYIRNAPEVFCRGKFYFLA